MTHTVHTLERILHLLVIFCSFGSFPEICDGLGFDLRYTIYGMGHKKVPDFRNTLPCNGNFAFRVRFRSVLQFSMFLLLCQHFKSTARRTVKERCENGNAACFFHCPFSNYCTSLLVRTCTSIKTSKSLDDSLEYLPSAAVPKFLSYVFHVLGEVKFGAWCSR